MTLQLLVFEWRYHFRQASTLALAAIFLLLGFAFGGLGALGEAHLHRDGAWAIAYAAGILSLGSVFLVMILATHAVLRDSTYGMAPIVHATAVSERRFLFVRWAGLWTSAVLLFSPALLGYWIGTLMPWVDPAQIGGSRAAFFLRPWLILILPDLVLVSTVLFAIAAATRSRLATYVAAFLLYALYMAGSVFFDSPLMAGSEPVAPHSVTFAALLDPFGLAAFLQQTHYWTLAERNTRLLGVEGSLLTNRLLWLGVSAFLLTAIARFFSFREASRPRRAREPSSPMDNPTKPIAYTPVTALPFGRRAALRALGARCRLELALVLRSRAFWLLLLVWIFVLTMEVVPHVVGGGEYGVDLYPATALIVTWLETPLLLVGTLAIVFYGGEVAAAERDAGVDPLVDTTPLSTSTRLGAKLVALASIPVLLIGTGCAVGVACQLAASYNRFDASAYLGLLPFQGIHLLLWAALALAIQALVRRKYLGMVATFAAYLTTTTIGVRAGLDHPLLRFGAAPKIVYTDMNGYGPAAASFPWFMLYWASVVLFALCLAHGLWPRGEASGLAERLRSLPERWGRSGLGVAISALLLAGGTGGFLYYRTCVERPWHGRAEMLDRRAAYEMRYARYDALPQPTVVAVSTRLDLFPKASRYRMDTDLVLENEGERPIESILFTEAEGHEVQSLHIEGASLTHRDRDLGVWWFTLEKALRPGERRKATYVLWDRNRGIDVDRSFADDDIVSNGTCLMEEFFAPRIGYRGSLEVENAFERRRRGLPERPEPPSDDEHLAASARGVYPWVSFDAVVSTDADQIAIAPGRLVREWREGNRQFFHYRSDGPIARAIAFFSARYAVAKTRHRGTEIEVYHHPEHAANVRHILEVARQTLEWGEESFGPYGRDHLRLVEVPATWPFGGFAMAGTIALTADRNFLVDVRSPGAFDLVAKRTAHEVAHQWWGHRVHPVAAPGGTLLVESLAKYAEWAVLDRLHGRRQTRVLLEHEHRRYQEGRARDPEPEVPLARVEDQAYLFYGKGYLALNALREALGREELARILQGFATTWARPHPAPRAEDLLAALEEEGSGRTRQVVDDWFRRIVDWEVEVLSASTRPRDDGSWETHLELSARKRMPDARGASTEIPVHDWIQVGLFATDDVLDDGGTLYLREHLFEHPMTKLILRTRHRPLVAGFDPFTVLIDPDRTDNLAPVTLDAGASPVR